MHKMCYNVYTQCVIVHIHSNKDINWMCGQSRVLCSVHRSNCWEEWRHVSRSSVMQLITRVTCWVWLLLAARKRQKHCAEAPTHGLQHMVTKNRTHTFVGLLHGPAERDTSGNQMCSCGIVETCARGMPSSNHELGQLPYAQTKPHTFLLI